jgi:dolichyl-phosphate beta-glucosyltransferase
MKSPPQKPPSIYNSHMSIHLSIVIPAYNEAKRLTDSLDKIKEFMDKQNFSYEVLIVENGSRDGTFEIALQCSRRFEKFSVIHENLIGKGNAVRVGMLAANGEYRFMCDADLSMPIEEIVNFLSPQVKDPQIVIASRELEGSVRHDEPESRHIGGRLINTMIQSIVLPGFEDSQCGFKLFRADIAEDLFSHQTLEGWAFDIEILAIARMRGYEVKEIPINWYYSEESKIQPLRDAFRMTTDMFKIRRNLRRGIYAKKV